MNWGQSFVNGLSTGHSVTQSLIDQYREQEAQRELQNTLKSLEKGGSYSGQASALEGSVNLNGLGKEGAINTDTTPEKGWMDSTTEENLAKIDKARGTVDKYIGGVLDQLGTPRTFEINGVPVEDRSTPYKRNRVLPTDTGVKTVHNSFTIDGVPVEDASTPYYKNEIIRQAVEGQARPKSEARAIKVSPGATAQRSADPVKSLERYQARSAPQPAEKQGGQRAIRLNPNGTSVDGSLPVSYSHRAGEYTPPKVPERFAKEEQIARDRRANERLNVEQAQLDRFGGGPIRPSGEPSGNVSAKSTDNAGDFMQQYLSGQLATQPQGQASAIRGGSAAQPAPQAGQPQTRGQTQTTPQAQGQASALAGGAQGSGQPAGQIQTQDGRVLDIGGGDPNKAIQLQPGSGNAQIGGQGNSYTDMDYRTRQRQIMVAEAKYLLQVDPRAGIAAMKQINQQDAQWELSDMYRGAMQGDPASLGKIVQYMNIGQGDSEIVVSGDGTFAEYKTPNGTQRIQITPELIRQTLPTVQATFMLVNGMASDKAIELMQSMMTTGLQQQKLQSEIDRNNAYTGYLNARAQGAGTPQGLKLFATTDAEGNPILVDQNTQRIYDQGSGVLLPRGFTAGRMAEVRAKYGDDAHLGTAPDGRDVVGTANGKVFDLATGEEINPNQPTAASAKEESGDADSVSLAAGMIKGLEGFQAEPYSDYAQTSIGYGTRANEGEKSITEAEASKRLMDHIQTEITPKLDKALAAAKVGLTPEQKASLISLCYNVGTDTFLRSSAFQALKGGDIKRFVTEVSDPERGFTKTRTAMGGLQVNPGLVERRRKEMEPFLA